MVAGSLELTELYAPISAELARVEDVIERELRSKHPFVNELCRRVGMYHGKMLRPALLLLCGKAYGELNEDHSTLAGVVEIVHLATLVHDDVLDDAELRRQQPTINATEGNTAAVLLGDFLISHAYHLCSSLDDAFACRAIGATTNTVCEGELLEVHHRHDVAITEEQYFAIIHGKTASLIGTCCALGAHYAGADRDTVNAVRSFGESAGLAFQIVDDILDLTGDESSTGKQVGSDLAHGSATLPIIHCLITAPDDIRSRLQDFIAGHRRYSRGEIRIWLEEAGSVEYALDAARGYVESALAHLRGLAPSPAVESLSTMTEFILRRRF